MNTAEQKAYCQFCGRDDVPLCPRCGKRVPHGMAYGTWLPCGCEKEVKKEKK